MGKNKKKTKKGNGGEDAIKSAEAELNRVDEKESIDQTKLEESPVTKESDLDDTNDLDNKISEVKPQVSGTADETETNVSIISQELNKAREERDEFERQYNTLLSRIASMKSVFNKMKEAQAELENAQEQLSEYETQNTHLKNRVASLERDGSMLHSTITALNSELTDAKKAQDSWRVDISRYESRIVDLEKELEARRESRSQHTEALKLQNEQLNLKVQELTVVLENHKQDLATLEQEKEELQSTVNTQSNENRSLKTALENLHIQIQDIKTTNADEIKTKDLEISALRAQLDTERESRENVSKEATLLSAQLEETKKQLAIKEKYEQEAKDHLIQIGKLRHESIILNEHLTKALSMLKQSSDTDNVDKELISNLIISFVTIPRADNRKFEVLELIASFLNWDDDKKEQAGLIINQSKSKKASGSVSKTESFVSLWTDYLERQSEN